MGDEAFRPLVVMPAYNEEEAGAVALNLPFNLTDTTSGFKLMDRDALTLFSNDYPAEYLGDTIEALVVAARNGVVVRQVGVEMRDRKGGQPSHSPFKAAIFLLRAVVVLVLALTRAMPRGKG